MMSWILTVATQITFGYLTFRLGYYVGGRKVLDAFCAVLYEKLKEAENETK
jgi:hypothetical protein